MDLFDRDLFYVVVGKMNDGRGRKSLLFNLSLIQVSGLLLYFRIANETSPGGIHRVSNDYPLALLWDGRFGRGAGRAGEMGELCCSVFASGVQFECFPVIFYSQFFISLIHIRLSEAIPYIMPEIYPFQAICPFRTKAIDMPGISAFFNRSGMSFSNLAMAIFVGNSFGFCARENKAIKLKGKTGRAPLTTVNHI
jgi:hypothetical protein